MVHPITSPLVHRAGLCERFGERQKTAEFPPQPFLERNKGKGKKLRGEISPYRLSPPAPQAKNQEPNDVKK